MLRIVSFQKAILAGACGALAWELVLRALILFGAPLHDMTAMLGSLFTPADVPWIWWSAGMALHAGVGAVCAIFYAYFVWSVFRWPPVVQGVVFSIGPAVLSLLIMHPQLELMHPMYLSGEMARGGFLGLHHGWGEPTGEFLGHLVYGAVLGALYTHPVGYKTARRFAHG